MSRLKTAVRIAAALFIVLVGLPPPAFGEEPGYADIGLKDSITGAIMRGISVYYLLFVFGLFGVA